MTIHYEGQGVTLHHGNCLDVLVTLPDASVDAVVTDPPYGLEFMGKEWDKFDRNGPASFEKLGKPFAPYVRSAENSDPYRDIPRFSTLGPLAIRHFQAWCEQWAAQCLRVLKPGGHLLAFGGSRTHHRLTSGVEDAGFEIRDTIAWHFASGFPKSLDVSKAITATERHGGANSTRIRRARLGDDYTETGRAGNRDGVGGPQSNRLGDDPTRFLETTLTDAARQWAGWGTALKPATEFVVVARKPLTGTVAANVQAWGTGALNIDATRIGLGESEDRAKLAARSGGSGEKFPNGIYQDGMENDGGGWKIAAAGRWPSNAVFDETQAARLDEQSGESVTQVTRTNPNRESDGGMFGLTAGGARPNPGAGEVGGASRFFFVAKADTSERPSYYRPSCSCETMKPWPEASPHTDTDDSESDAVKSSSTSSSGSGTTGAPSLPVTTSTTGTATSSTTTSPTSSSSPNWSTSASTPAASSATANGGSPAGSAECSSPSPSSIGTSAPKAGPSTAGAVPATSPAWSATSVCGNCGAPARRELHSTVKPLALMRHLVRLVTPPGGTVLEPFAGSGTTVEACLLEGFRCIAIEKTDEYLPLVLARIHRQRDPVQAIKLAGEPLGLFDFGTEETA